MKSANLYVVVVVAAAAVDDGDIETMDAWNSMIAF